MMTTIKIPEYKTTIRFSGYEQYALVFPPKYGYSPLFYADEFEAAAHYLEFTKEGYKGIKIIGKHGYQCKIYTNLFVDELYAIRKHYLTRNS